MGTGHIGNSENVTSTMTDGNAAHTILQSNPRSSGTLIFNNNTTEIQSNAEDPRSLTKRITSLPDSWTLMGFLGQGQGGGPFKLPIYLEQFTNFRLTSLFFTPLGPETQAGCSTLTPSFREDKELDPYTNITRMYQGHVGSGHKLRVHLTNAFKRSVSMMDVLDLCNTDIELILTKKDRAQMVVDLDEIDSTKALFFITNTLATTHGLNRLPHTVSATAEDVSHVLCAAAYWCCHLAWKPDRNPIGDLVRLEFTRVEHEGNRFDDQGMPVMKPTGTDLNATGVVDLVVNPRHYYGVKIINNSTLGLHPYLLYFDVNDQSIISYRDDPSNPSADPPLLRAGSSITVGYGVSGAVPFAYELGDGQGIDVGFLKLFLTTSPVDLSALEQHSAFLRPRHSGQSIHTIDGLDAVEHWGTVLSTIVQRSKPNTLGTHDHGIASFDPGYKWPIPLFLARISQWLWSLVFSQVAKWLIGGKPLSEKRRLPTRKT